MIEYNKHIDKIVEKYADLGVGDVLNVAGGSHQSVNQRVRQAAKDRIHILINKRISSPYNKRFTKQDNEIIYKLVTKTLLHLTHLK
jgi:hypothetical protein